MAAGAADGGVVPVERPSGRDILQHPPFAGMRLGYAIGAPALINALTTTKNSFNHFPTDAFCQTAAIAACSDIEWYVENCRKVINTRDIFCKALSDSLILKLWLNQV